MFTRTDIEKYFLAEKQVSALFIYAGVVAIALSILFFFFLRSNFYRGAALPLLVIGLMQGAAGYTVFRRSDGDRVRNVYAYDMNPDQLRQEELPRMKKVNKNFVLYRWIEIVLLVTGVCLVLYFKSDASRQFWYGLGLTLAIEAAMLFGADFAAEQRAHAYTKGLEAFLEKKH